MSLSTLVRRLAIVSAFLLVNLELYQKGLTCASPFVDADI